MRAFVASYGVNFYLYFFIYLIGASTRGAVGGVHLFIQGDQKVSVRLMIVL